MTFKTLYAQLWSNKTDYINANNIYYIGMENGLGLKNYSIYITPDQTLSLAEKQNLSWKRQLWMNRPSRQLSLPFQSAVPNQSIIILP
jgi:hypothetical protein